MMVLYHSSSRLRYHLVRLHNFSFPALSLFLSLVVHLPFCAVMNGAGEEGDIEMAVACSSGKRQLASDDDPSFHASMGNATGLMLTAALINNNYITLHS